jgi:hypothetical protein
MSKIPEKSRCIYIGNARDGLHRGQEVTFQFNMAQTLAFVRKDNGTGLLVKRHELELKPLTDNEEGVHLLYREEDT